MLSSLVSCSKDDEYVIEVCPRDCKLHHVHRFSDGHGGFYSEEWKDDTKQESN